MLSENSLYQKLCNFDNEKTIVNDFKEYNNSAKVALLINKNLSKMDESEKRYLLLKLLDEKRVMCELIKYELRHLNLGKVISNFIEFTDFMEKSLSRYHMYAGGFLCEDTEWTKHDHTSNKYPLLKNEVIFENSVKRYNRNDCEINNYIDDLMSFFKIHKDENLNLSFRLIESSNEIYWMCFKLTDKHKRKNMMDK